MFRIKGSIAAVLVKIYIFKIKSKEVPTRSMPVQKYDVTRPPSRFIFTLTHIGTFMTRGYYVL